MEKKYVFMEKEYTRAISNGGNSFILTDAPEDVSDEQVKRDVFSSIATPYSYAQFDGDVEELLK